MALIVEQHVIADNYPVGTTAIKGGMVVGLNSDGKAVPAYADAATPILPLGIAGDSALDEEGQTTADSESVVIGAEGAASKYTSNRVSDFYDETTASGKITVYTGGGKFWISEDLIESVDSVAPMDTLYTAASGNAGYYSETTTDATEVAKAVGEKQAYQSGVPGTDTRGSMTLGNFVPIVLTI